MLHLYVCNVCSVLALCGATVLRDTAHALVADSENVCGLMATIVLFTQTLPTEGRLMLLLLPCVS